MTLISPRRGSEFLRSSVRLWSSGNDVDHLIRKGAAEDTKLSSRGSSSILIALTRLATSSVLTGFTEISLLSCLLCSKSKYATGLSPIDSVIRFRCTSPFFKIFSNRIDHDGDNATVPIYIHPTEKRKEFSL